MSEQNQEVEKLKTELDNVELKPRTVLDSRIARRQIKTTEQYLKDLVKDFIDIKNKNFTEKDGFIIWNPTANIVFREFNTRWKNRLQNDFRRKKKIVTYDPDIFAKKIEQHKLIHAKIAWVNHVQKLCKENFRYQPEYETVNAVYVTDKICIDAAYEIIRKSFIEPALTLKIAKESKLKFKIVNFFVSLFKPSPKCIPSLSRI